MNTKNIDKLILIVFTIILSLMLTACGRSEEVPVSVPPGAQAGDLTLEPCIYEASNAPHAQAAGGDERDKELRYVQSI